MLQILEFLEKNLGKYSSQKKIASIILQQWPDHEKFLKKRFSDDPTPFLESSERLANDILKLCGERLDEYCEDYRWMCEVFFREELYFRRHKQYRLSTLKEAREEVYEDGSFMKRYMCGLLISQLIWRNHAAVFEVYRRNYLPIFNSPFTNLEIGPGHGLFLGTMAQHKYCENSQGWDISEESLRITNENMNTLGVSNRVSLVRRDIADVKKSDPQFDSITISEVFEHVEQPDHVLAGLMNALKPSSYIFINIPVNSPAPDHIYLWRSPEDVERFVQTFDLEIIESHHLPLTGFTLEEARERELTISTVIIARS